MIKPNELRVGNWVYVIEDGVSRYRRIKSVGDAIPDGYISYDHPKMLLHGSTTLGLGIVKPIPLTHEILERCTYTNTVRMENIAHTGTMYAGNIELVFEFFGFEWADNSIKKFNPTIEYLHQMQNLYFILTGQELGIELP